MGCTVSAEERAAIARTKKINQEIKEEERKKEKDVKLLLLAATNSCQQADKVPHKVTFCYSVVGIVEMFVIEKKRPHVEKIKILFHQDNVHTCSISIAKIIELKFELVQHPPYSPHLAPSDFFLFLNLKKSLGGRRFTSNEEVIAQTDPCFEDLPKSHFFQGLESWRNARGNLFPVSTSL
ncbi:hypothetical protein AMK59_4170 [Oryctes borbonicus]|uniref:Tc1-like transposase DDE domain-containing protein n=1 Tax=Oryctes borbonicus TaxID=1629725 RepID=A0A0T6B8Q9_9SCAR|nr:hypothetical protein AMK59_4170 [Oryctes borbonicus]